MEINKILGNYLTQPNRDFPLDCETLNYIQQNQALLAVLGNTAGDKIILLGCELVNNNTSRVPGFVFLRTVDFPNGEILYYSGGAVAAGLYLKKEIISINAQNIEYPQAYVKRSLAPGTGSEAYVWNDFTTLTANKDLAQKNAEQDAAIAALAPPPLGIVQMFAGAIEKIPQNYLPCGGQELLVSEYQELYGIIGRLHTPLSVVQTLFRLPDLRSRFIVGYNIDDTDYNAIAKTGGEKKHILTVSEMPVHSHNLNIYNVNSEHSDSGHSYYPAQFIQKTPPSGTDMTRTGETLDRGSGLSHENRPPYYTLAYIMRVR
jgi:microcystin-dependent protein